MNDETFFRAAVLILYSLFLLMRGFFALGVWRSGGKVFSAGDDLKREGRLHFLFSTAMEVILPASFFLYVLHPEWVARLSLPVPVWLRLAGVVASVLSLIFLAAVHRALGRHWAVSLHLKEGHRLVTAGPYARVRHPMYTALFGNMIGHCLMASNLVVLLPRAAQMLNLYLRIEKEEAMMLERFGDEYSAYMGRTGRLLPHPR